MTDIVERLRLLVPSDSSGAAFDAVNEITRLRNELHITQEWSARVIAGRKQDIAVVTALRAENERLEGALQRAHIVLGNMAMENEGAILKRWPISHEPLRADAKALLPVIRAALDEKPND